MNPELYIKPRYCSKLSGMYNYLDGYDIKDADRIFTISSASGITLFRCTQMKTRVLFNKSWVTLHDLHITRINHHLTRQVRDREKGYDISFLNENFKKILLKEYF